MDLSSIGKQEWTIENGKTFSVEVVDSVSEYLQLMKEVFDFVKLKQFLTGEKAPKIILNAMHGGKFWIYMHIRSFISDITLHSGSLIYILLVGMKCWGPIFRVHDRDYADLSFVLLEIK